MIGSGHSLSPTKLASTINIEYFSMRLTCWSL